MANAKPKFTTIALLSAFITSIVACTVDSISENPVSDTSGTKVTDINQSLTTTIVSQDEILQFTMPQTWKNAWTEAEQERWTLLIQHPSGQAQIGARSWNKDENPEATLDFMAEIALQAGSAPFANPEIVEQAKSISVNGHTAVQHQVRGTVLGHRLVALSTVIETPHYYHLVFTLVPEQDFEQQWNEADQIIQSLQEVQSTASVQLNLSNGYPIGNFSDMAYPK